MKDVVKPEEFGLEPTKAADLLANLPVILSERKPLEAQYLEIVSAGDIENPDTHKQARELRLKIRDNRTKGIEPWHKANKELFLRAGQFLDAIKKKEVENNKRMEDALEQIEKYPEIKEAKRIAELKEWRTEELGALLLEWVPPGVDLGLLTDEEYSKVYKGAKLQYEEHQQALQLAEQEKARLERVEELHKERTKLALPYYQFWSDFEKQLNFGEQSDGDFEAFLARIKKAKDDYDKQQAEIRAENDRLAAEAAKAKAALQAKLDEEEQARKAQEAADKKAEEEKEELAKQSIEKQLEIWVDSFSIKKAPIHNDCSKDIHEKFEGFKLWAYKQVYKLK
jgi:colicin import membrane protein